MLLYYGDGWSANCCRLERKLKYCRSANSHCRTPALLLLMLSPANTRSIKCNRRGEKKRTACCTQVAAKPRLHTTQGHHADEMIRVRASDRRQQLTVKAAESIAEGLTLDWVRVDLQGVALQGHHEDAPAT